MSGKKMQPIHFFFFWRKIFQIKWNKKLNSGLLRFNGKLQQTHFFILWQKIRQINFNKICTYCIVLMLRVCWLHGIFTIIFFFWTSLLAWKSSVNAITLIWRNFLVKVKCRNQTPKRGNYVPITHILQSKIISAYHQALRFILIPIQKFVKWLNKTRKMRNIIDFLEMWNWLYVHIYKNILQKIFRNTTQPPASQKNGLFAAFKNKSSVGMSLPLG